MTVIVHNRRLSYAPGRQSGRIDYHRVEWINPPPSLVGDPEVLRDRPLPGREE
jgi:hypothetical protein